MTLFLLLSLVGIVLAGVAGFKAGFSRAITKLARHQYRDNCRAFEDRQACSQKGRNRP